MSNRDGTGPNGKGPNTGRGLGPCGRTKPKKRVTKKRKTSRK